MRCKIFFVVFLLVPLTVPIFAMDRGRFTAPCARYERLVQEYLDTKRSYSQSRRGWNRVWETGRDAGTVALFTRGWSDNWQAIARNAAFGAAGSIAKQEVSGIYGRRSLRDLERDLDVAAGACEASQSHLVSVRGEADVDREVRSERRFQGPEDEEKVILPESRRRRLERERQEKYEEGGDYKPRTVTYAFTNKSDCVATVTFNGREIKIPVGQVKRVPGRPGLEPESMALEVDGSEVYLSQDEIVRTSTTAWVFTNPVN